MPHVRAKPKLTSGPAAEAGSSKVSACWRRDMPAQPWRVVVCTILLHMRQLMRRVRWRGQRGGGCSCSPRPACRARACSTGQDARGPVRLQLSVDCQCHVKFLCSSSLCAATMRRLLRGRSRPCRAAGSRLACACPQCQSRKSVWPAQVSRARCINESCIPPHKTPTCSLAAHRATAAAASSKAVLQHWRLPI